MANVFDYIKWRGDLSFRQDPPNDIDALVFSSIIYLHFSGRLLDEPGKPLLLREAAEEFLTLEDQLQRARNRNDIELLRAAAASSRFGFTKMVMYRDLFVPEQDTQFAAVTFLLDDGSIFVAFRGTDNTLVGWKEDFNMTFLQTVPAQLLALDYVREVHNEYVAPMRLGGHSKGGNLAVFAAARSSPMLQKWILGVYNNDGPGFTEYMIGDPGYRAMIPRIRTFVPQSSIIGMLLEHEEPYTIIHSTQVSLLQHDTFSWEVMGKEFVPMEEITADSRFLNQTLKNWLNSLDHQERNRVVDGLFDLLSSGNVIEADDIFQLKNLRNYLRIIGENESTRQLVTGQLRNILDAAKRTRLMLENGKK